MKKYLLLLIALFTASHLSAQEIKISHRDVIYFVDTLTYDLKVQLPDGIYNVYYDSAKTVMDYSGELSSQNRVNTWTWYFETGSKKHETTYQNGVINGQEVFYYPNGQMSVTNSFSAGIQNGQSFGWYTTGTKMFEGAYASGKPIGTWKFYDETGTLVKEEQH